jgi:hypothetical protein
MFAASFDDKPVTFWYIYSFIGPILTSLNEIEVIEDNGDAVLLTPAASKAIGSSKSHQGRPMVSSSPRKAKVDLKASRYCSSRFLPTTFQNPDQTVDL